MDNVIALLGLAATALVIAMLFELIGGGISQWRNRKVFRRFLQHLDYGKDVEIRCHTGRLGYDTFVKVRWNDLFEVWSWESHLDPTTGASQFTYSGNPPKLFANKGLERAFVRQVHNYARDNLR